MKVKTIKGEEITIYEKEIIWNALEFYAENLAYGGNVFVALLPRRSGTRVDAGSLAGLTQKIRSKYA